MFANIKNSRIGQL